MTIVTPGWYPEPGGQRGMRWWDGQAWTEHVHDPTAPPAPGFTPMPDLPAAAPTLGFTPLPDPPMVPPTPGYTPMPDPPTVGAAGPTPPADRAWVPFAIVGAVALVAVVGLAVLVLGRSSNRTAVTASASASTSTSSTSSTSTSTSTSSPGPTAPPLTAPPSAIPGAKELFVDPAGVYSMSIGPDWTSVAGGVMGMPAWSMGASSGGFASNANVATENLPGAFELDEYVAATVASLQKVKGIEVVEQVPIALSDGSPAVVIHTRNSMTATTFPQTAVVTLKGRHAVIVTLSAASPQILTANEPFARSLHLL